MDRLGPWPARVAWVLLPVVAGAALADALDGRSTAVQWVASIGLWAVWAGVLVATLLPRTASLTALRIAAPASLGAAVWAAPVDGVSGADVVALVWTAVVCVVAFSPWTGDVFVNGSSYGAERRLTLRVPAALALGPVELAWVAVVGGAIAGPLLLAARQWVLGAVAVAAGLAVVRPAVRSLHSLARRWVVFVPAGIVLHDPLALAENQLFPRRMVVRLEPAPADPGDALDLTRGALGLALVLEASEPVSLAVRTGRVRTNETVDATAVLFTPTRPAALLAEARERRIG
jgi:hypothetical protein